VSVLATTLEENKEQIRTLVGRVLQIDPAELTEEGLFREDHHADSLQTLGILAALEDEFDLRISQSEIIRIVNLVGVYAVVAEAAGWQE
jgi:acyl carrier protein